MKVKTSRSNWSVGEAKERLNLAVKNWKKNEGEPPQDEPKFRCVSMPRVSAYLWPNFTPIDERRAAVGAHAGRPSLMHAKTQSFVVDVLRRHDRGNEDLSKQEAVAMVEDLLPELSHEQAMNSFRRTIRKKNKHMSSRVLSKRRLRLPNETRSQSRSSSVSLALSVS